MEAGDVTTAGLETTGDAAGDVTTAGRKMTDDKTTEAGDVTTAGLETTDDKETTAAAGNGGGAIKCVICGDEGAKWLCNPCNIYLPNSP
ncbi:MAG: hypothetical protein GY737_14480 [Desulfobacteraceae bacterium]|nr:hypothetical protein [Desulfobacteraceae bacterium]